MRAILGRRALERQAASTNTVSRFKTEVLTRPENLKGLVRLDTPSVQHGMARTATPAGHHRHGQLQEPGARRTGKGRLQRTLRRRLLSSL